MEDLSPEMLARLQAIADAAEVDMGLNSTKNGRHSDPGHAAGTAVDIGYLNGKDIGHGSTTYSGMAALSLRVQQAAANQGGLKWTGNLGPAGKFNGAQGPKPIIDPVIRDAHKNHIHLSWSTP